MDEFGEDRSFYIWPTGHEPGQPFPKDFQARVERALAAEGLSCESI